MSDLFKQADMRQVLHGDSEGKPVWNLGSDSLQCSFVSDDVGHRYAVVIGTAYVIDIFKDTAGLRYGLWRDGLLGSLEGVQASLDAALLEVKRRMPAHLISRLYQEAGRPRRVAL